MKVLLLSLFHPEIVRGGAQQICYELFKGLQETPGIEPILLAAIDPSFPTFYKSGARITGFDGRPNEYLFLGREYDYLWHRTASPDLIESFAEFLTLTSPDIVHFHHFLLLGIDLIPLVRRVLPKAKIVFTLHEFLSICSADGQFIRRNDGSLCDHASPVRCHQCFPERGPDHFFMREQWFKKNFSYVDRFTTPSKAMIGLFDKWGLSSSRITWITNGQRNHAGERAQDDEDTRRHNRFGFFGQLVDNKGVSLLLDAVQLLRSEGFTDFLVEINGDNLKYASASKRKHIEDYLAAEVERPVDERLVQWNGPYEVGQLRSRMRRIDWCIVPSIWYETFALVISEAWMFGRPVICSDIGAMAERVTHGKDGLHFPAGDARALAEVVRYAATDADAWSRLAKGIVVPPSRETMVHGFVDLYRDLLEPSRLGSQASHSPTTLTHGPGSALVS